MALTYPLCPLGGTRPRQLQDTLCLLKTQDEAPEPAEPPSLLLDLALQGRRPSKAEGRIRQGGDRGGLCGVPTPGAAPGVC